MIDYSKYMTRDVNGFIAIECEHGRIMPSTCLNMVALCRLSAADRESLFRWQLLARLGDVIGDDGKEGKVQFSRAKFKDVAGILKPLPAPETTAEST